MAFPAKKFKLPENSSLMTCATAPSCDVDALPSEYSSVAAITKKGGSKSEFREREDWTQNHVILTEIFKHLPIADLKLARFVCKFWARIAAPVLTAKSVLRFDCWNSKGSATLTAFLDFGRTKVWESGFTSKMQNVDLKHVRFQPAWLEHFEYFVASDTFKCVSSLTLCYLDHTTIFKLLLPHWLPTHLKKLKTLKITDFLDYSDIFNDEKTLPILEEKPPTGASVDLERLIFEYSVIERHANPRFWSFLRNCTKLKHLELSEKLHVSTQELHDHHENILRALDKTQLDSLALQFSGLSSSELVEACKSFTKRLVEANGGNLKNFSVNFHIGSLFVHSAQLLSPTWTLAPSVKNANFHIESIESISFHSGIDEARVRGETVAQLLPSIYNQWYRNGLKLTLEIMGNKYVRNCETKLIIKSPTDIAFHLGTLNAFKCNEVLRDVLRSMFPEINYVCCARQSPTDGGFSYETTLMERFGKDGVFDLFKVFTKMAAAGGKGDSLFEMETFENTFFGRGTLGREINILDPRIIREAAVGAEGWSNQDLEMESGQVFVFGHVPLNRMAEAWTKIQNRFCTFKSFEDGFTPEVVRSGQGSFTVYRKFITWVDESYTGLRNRILKIHEPHRCTFSSKL